MDRAGLIFWAVYLILLFGIGGAAYDHALARSVQAEWEVSQ